MALRLIADASEPLRFPGLALIPRDARLELSTQEHLDQLDRTLVAYDIRSLTNALRAQATGDLTQDAAAERIVETITSYTEPNAWVSHGGATASLSVTGHTLLINAPARFFPRIDWILAQLRRGNPTPLFGIGLWFPPSSEDDCGCFGS